MSGASQKPIEEKVLEWLESEGYPLEMRVARGFRKCGFRVIQSEYYDDPDTGKSREVDVVADVLKTCDQDRFRTWNVELVVECKMSSKPWVLFSSGSKIASRARVAQRCASKLGQRYLIRIAKEKWAQDLPLMQLPTSGYGLTPAFGGSDAAFEALMSASKAAVSRVAKFDDLVAHTPFTGFVIVFPVIVVDGLLFEASLKTDGSIKLESRDSGTIVWRNRLFQVPHTIVHVVTQSAFSGFATDAFASAHALLEEIDEEHDST